ncbi:MAG: cation diffusion facilitator family transporter [Actinobacteria bacterium]|nr:cation diffusion facilitator family transporter [Actinomycetota bacterium]
MLTRVAASNRFDEARLEPSARTDDGPVTVALALGANIAVGVLKLAAGLISGSGALLSEAAHSAGDTSTEVLLLVALRRSSQPADRRHPFGYGKARYFWSLLAAVAIFVVGSAFSLLEGVRTIAGRSEPMAWLWINYPVLAVAAVLEGVSFAQAARRLRAASGRGGRSVRDYLRVPDDPTVNSVAVEDSSALIGILIAGAGVALHQITGSAVWDGVASVLIGLLLLGAAVLLARACEGLLIGQQADPRLVREIERQLESHAEIEDVVDLLTMMTGVSRVLVCARVDFVDDVSAGELETACLRADAELRERFPMLDEIFIQPAPRSDRGLRDRVRARYGVLLADDATLESEPGPPT